MIPKNSVLVIPVKYIDQAKIFYEAILNAEMHWKLADFKLMQKKQLHAGTVYKLPF
jgi:hypothetical protein